MFDPVAHMEVGLPWDKSLLFSLNDFFFFTVVLKKQVVDIFGEFLL